METYEVIHLHSKNKAPRELTGIMLKGMDTPVVYPHSSLKMVGQIIKLVLKSKQMRFLILLIEGERTKGLNFYKALVRSQLQYTIQICHHDFR